MASTCRPIQSFYMVMGLSKNVAYHGWPTTQNKKKTLAKTPWSRKRKPDQNIHHSKFNIWNPFFKNIISAIQLYNIRSHVSVDNIRVFLNFGFSSRMSQSQQKLEKRSLILLCSFTQETSLILRTSNHLIEKNDMLLQHCKVNNFICVKLGTHNSFVLWITYFLHCNWYLFCTLNSLSSLL